MGNTESKKRDENQSKHHPDRLTQRPKPELVSVPIDEAQFFENPDTPSSTNEEPESFLQGNVEIQQTLQAALQLNLIRQLHRKFQTEASSSCFELISGFVDVRFYEQIATIAESLGFKSVEFNSPTCKLVKEGLSANSTKDISVHDGFLSLRNLKLDLKQLEELDVAVEEGLKWFLALEIRTKKALGDSSTVWTGHLGAFLLPEDIMERIFKQISQEAALNFQNQENGNFALLRIEESVPDLEKVEKTIQLGELVWRRLQHWSTNVRKEKKFNIWTKGLPENVKEKISEIALEIGFEVAEIQPNGNIHVEIKPPEGIHRRKLRHATEELRESLIPIDEAVCKNVEEYLTDWLSNFKQSGKMKETLGCRFVLPADWLKKTAERLAENQGLKVAMETGIEFVFYKSDVDLVQLKNEEESQNKGLKSTKKRSKQQPRKKRPNVNGQEINTPSNREFEKFNNLRNRTETVGATGVINGQSRSDLNFAFANRSAMRRDVGLRDQEYGWNHNWPVPQFYQKEFERFSS